MTTHADLDAIQPGDTLRIKFGSHGTQRAVLIRKGPMRWYVRKWRAASKRWTGAIAIDPRTELADPTS